MSQYPTDFKETMTLSRQHLSQTWQRSYSFDDVWYDVDDLVSDHIEEVMEKWNTIDDQIWGKVILMEKNSRVGKVFLNRSEIVVTNEDSGFDITGKIGLRGFDNKMRDYETNTILKKLGKGCKIWMDLGGNIWIKNLSRSVDCHMTEGSYASPPSEVRTSRKLFDVNRFKADIRKLTKTNDLKSLSQQTVSIVQFGEPKEDVLDQPLWLMVINIVALDFMKTKLGIEITRTDSDELRSAGNNEEDEEDVLGHPISWHGLHSANVTAK